MVDVSYRMTVSTFSAGSVWMVALGGSVVTTGRGGGGGTGAGLGAGGGVLANGTTLAGAGGAGGLGAGGFGAGGGALTTGAGRGGGGGTTFLTSGAVTLTGATSTDFLRKRNGRASRGRPSSSHRQSKPLDDTSGLAGKPGALTDVVTEAVPSGVDVLTLSFAASAAGRVTRPPAFDHWISVPPGPTNLPVSTPSAMEVSAVG